MSESDAFQGWAILELLGHRRLGGWLSEATVAGASFLRIDIPPVGDRAAVTQLYSPASVYAITPTTEEIATAAARYVRFQPVNRWELEAPPKPDPDLTDVESDYEDLSDDNEDGAF